MQLERGQCVHGLEYGEDHRGKGDESERVTGDTARQAGGERVDEVLGQDAATAVTQRLVHADEAAVLLNHTRDRGKADEHGDRKEDEREHRGDGLDRARIALDARIARQRPAILDVPLCAFDAFDIGPCLGELGLGVRLLAFELGAALPGPRRPLVELRLALGELAFDLGTPAIELRLPSFERRPAEGRIGKGPDTALESAHKLAQREDRAFEFADLSLNGRQVALVFRIGLHERTHAFGLGGLDQATLLELVERVVHPLFDLWISQGQFAHGGGQFIAQPHPLVYAPGHLTRICVNRGDELALRRGITILQALPRTRGPRVTHERGEGVGTRHSGIDLRARGIELALGLIELLVRRGPLPLELGATVVDLGICGVELRGGGVELRVRIALRHINRLVRICPHAAGALELSRLTRGLDTLLHRIDRGLILIRIGHQAVGP